MKGTFDMVTQVLMLLNTTGILAGGVGLLKWGLTVEKRLVKIEVKMGIER